MARRASQRWSAGRLASMLGLCGVAVIVCGIVCLWFGSTGVGWPSGRALQFREISVVSAGLIGAALAAAGVAYQGVLRNPLADPYLLGVSSGASLLGYAWQLPMFGSIVTALGIFAPTSRIAAAFVGAIAAVSIVLGIAGRRGRLEPITLLLVGVIVNAVCGSVLMLINALARELPGSGGAMAYLAGEIQPIAWPEFFAAFWLIAVSWIALLFFSGQLNAAGLDDGEAESLGIRIHRLRWITLILASLMTAAAVAISGPIGFVGLICPHVGRRFVGSDQRRLLPVSTAIGAMLLMGADALCRFLSAENWLANLLPVGVLTGMLGGPVFLWMLAGRKRGVR